MDVTKLRTAIADAEKAAIDQAVKDGKLTQAQADLLKVNIKPENVYQPRGTLALHRGGFGGFDWLGGWDGFGGMGDHSAGASANDSRK